MARFFGVIGFAETTETTETKPGVWVEQITERNYYGDLTRNSRRLQSADQLNDNVTISNEIVLLLIPMLMRISIRCVTLSSWELNGRFQMSKFSSLD